MFDHARSFLQLSSSERGMLEGISSLKLIRTELLTGFDREAVTNL